MESVCHPPREGGEATSEPLGVDTRRRLTVHLALNSPNTTVVLPVASSAMFVSA
jgi:hypothetical protein